MGKIEKLRAGLAEKGIDAVIVLDELNQRYLTDFAFTDGLLLITHNHAELITDFRYYEMAEKGADKAFNVVIPEKRDEYIASILSADACKTVGFEGASVSYEAYLRYTKKHPGVEFVNIGSLIEDIRQLKTAEEIKIMQRAQDITELTKSAPESGKNYALGFSESAYH